MRLKGIALLAAHTARSQAYIQALIAHDLYPDQVITFGPEKPLEKQITPSTSEW